MEKPTFGTQQLTGDRKFVSTIEWYVPGIHVLLNTPVAGGTAASAPPAAGRNKSGAELKGSDMVQFFNESDGLLNKEIEAHAGAGDLFEGCTSFKSEGKNYLLLGMRKDKLKQVRLAVQHAHMHLCAISQIQS